MVKQLRLIWSAGGGAGGETALHFADTATSAQLVSAFNAFGAALAPVLAAGTNVGPLTVVRSLDTATGAITGESDLGDSPTVAGTGGPSQVANAAQGLIRINTGAIVGRRFLKGRIYVPGMSTQIQLGTGEVNGTGLAALKAAGDALRTGGIFGIWHRPSGGSPGTFALASSSSAWGEFAVQRRRRL